MKLEVGRLVSGSWVFIFLLSIPVSQSVLRLKSRPSVARLIPHPNADPLNPQAASRARSAPVFFSSPTSMHLDTEAAPNLASALSPALVLWSCGPALSATVCTAPPLYFLCIQPTLAAVSCSELSVVEMVCFAPFLHFVAASALPRPLLLP